MEIYDLLKPEAVKFVHAVSSKKTLLHAVSNLAAQAHNLEEASTLRALQEREALGPTGVGHGVALPHARVEGLSDVKAVFIRLEEPIDFGAVDRQPVDLFFGLFAPQDAGVEHLKALALVSRTMRDAGTCTKLRANEDTDTLFAILIEAHSKQAA